MSLLFSVNQIVPNNILLVGPTVRLACSKPTLIKKSLTPHWSQGSGKTECARRLAKTTNSPFVRTEATRFTEVGVVGGSVEARRMITFS